MKLKYYLNGFGIGVIFATIILSISFAVNINTIKNGMNNQVIENRARELGMVYANELKEDSSIIESTMPEEPSSPEILGEEDNSGEEISEQESETTQPETTQPETTQPETLTQPETTQNTVTVPGASVEKIPFQIYSGDSSEIVARRLQSIGIIEDASEFNAYVVAHGYSTILRVGTYELEKGNTYEEIVKKICK